MGDVIDFITRKTIIEDANIIEEEYQEFLTKLNSIHPTPKNLTESIHTLYYIMRYLEGTVQAISILHSLGIINDKKTIGELKEMILPWIDSIRENLSAI